MSQKHGFVCEESVFTYLLQVFLVGLIIGREREYETTLGITVSGNPLH